MEVVREFVEEALIPGTKDQALKGLRQYAEQVLRRDEAAAPHRGSLMEQLKQFLKPAQNGDYAVHIATRYIDSLEATYLQEWAAILGDPKRSSQMSAEGTAKRIVSHALYLGMPAPTIYSFFEALEESDEETDIADAVRQLDERIKRPKTAYTFAVPLNAAPGFLQANPPKAWLDAKQLKQWKHLHAKDVPKVRHHGGFILEVTGRDIYEAVRAAQDELVLLEFKFWVGSRNRFDTVGQMWCEKTGQQYPVHSSSGSEEWRLRAFERADALHELDISPRTKNVLALIEPLRMDNAQIAVVNG